MPSYTVCNYLNASTTLVGIVKFSLDFPIRDLFFCGASRQVINSFWISLKVGTWDIDPNFSYSVKNVD